MRIRLLISLGIALAIGVAAAEGAGLRSPRPLAIPAVCTIDSVMQDHTLRRVAHVLSAPATDSLALLLLQDYGLFGVSADSATVVADSTFCSSALDAYAEHQEDFDSTQRANFRNSLDGIYVVRLTPNRFVVNVGLYHPWWLYEHLVLDSTLALVGRQF